MKKLEHDIELTVPKEVRDEALKHDENFPDVEKVTMEIYHEYEKDDDYWEFYLIKIPVFEDEFTIKIASVMMDVSREIAEDGGGHVEEFIYEMVMSQVRQDAEESEARDFFEAISD